MVTFLLGFSNLLSWPQHLLQLDLMIIEHFSSLNCQSINESDINAARIAKVSTVLRVVKEWFEQG